MKKQHWRRGARTACDDKRFTVARGHPMLFGRNGPSLEESGISAEDGLSAFQRSGNATCAHMPSELVSLFTNPNMLMVVSTLPETNTFSRPRSSS
jgi:hypothetical protein